MSVLDIWFFLSCVASPVVWSCPVVSRPPWCWHRNLLPHGVSWEGGGGARGLIWEPYPSINVALQQLETEWKYLHLFCDPPSRGRIPTTCSLFMIRSDCFTHSLRPQAATPSSCHRHPSLPGRRLDVGLESGFKGKSLSSSSNQYYLVAETFLFFSFAIMS